MKPAWAVVWRGKSCVTYLDKNEQWTLDPDEAKVFGSWFAARFAAGIQAGVSIVRCWV